MKGKIKAPESVLIATILIGIVGALAAIIFIIYWKVDKVSEPKAEAVMYINPINAAVERGYMAGQSDILLNDDIKIQYNDEGDCWEWVDSPWDSGTAPSYSDCSSEE